MSENTEDWSDYIPDWTRIKKLAENLDKALDDGIKDGMNFIEIDIAFYMVREKLQQEKHRVLTETFEAENIKETQKNNQFYG